MYIMHACVDWTEMMVIKVSLVRNVVEMGYLENILMMQFVTIILSYTLSMPGNSKIHCSAFWDTL